jgi:hypothetical protein
VAVGRTYRRDAYTTNTNRLSLGSARGGGEDGEEDEGGGGEGRGGEGPAEGAHGGLAECGGRTADGERVGRGLWHQVEGGFHLPGVGLEFARFGLFVAAGLGEAESLGVDGAIGAEFVEVEGPVLLPDIAGAGVGGGKRAFDDDGDAVVALLEVGLELFGGAVAELGEAEDPEPLLVAGEAGEVGIFGL